MRVRLSILLIPFLLAAGQELSAQAGAATARQLVWIDRSGQVQEAVGPRMAAILDPSISPDGGRIAVRGRQNQGDTEHLWILQGAAANRLTANEGSERHMIWSPDGSRIAYSIQNPGGVSNLFVRAADGSGGDRPLIVSEGMHKWYPSWSPDASTVVFHIARTDDPKRDLWYLEVATGRTGVLVEDDGIQALARMSLDGRFVAYQSDHDGSMEIWVTTFPRSDARWKVSTNGGTWPKWSLDELFYWEGNQLVAVPFTTGQGGEFRPGAPQRLFTGAQVGMGDNNQMTSYNPEYDVTPDGRRFVVTQRVQP
jgi:eukaryotic-like serine/threonine-protein kinase